jgi:hypothetical protein
MEDEGIRCRKGLAPGKTGSRNTAALHSFTFDAANCFSLLIILACCGGCALRYETAGGDSWSVGVSRHTVKLQPLDDEIALAKDNSQAAPIEFAVIPSGIEAAFGWQQQARGFVVSNDITNRFLPPSGFGFGNMDSWHFGFVHYRIPREKNRVQLMVNTVKGGALRVANADPCLRIGFSKTTLITVLEDTAGTIEFRFSPSAPDFNYSVQPIAPP